MIEIEQISPNAHQILVIGEMHQDDAEKFTAFARQELESGGGGNLLIDITSVADMTFSAFSEELIHLPSMLKYIYGLDRIAIISDEKWLRSAARLESALLPKVVYQVYSEDEEEAARAWILEQSDEPHRGAVRALDIGKPQIAAFEISGRLDRAESERSIAWVSERLDAPDCSRLMLVIRSWHGFDPDVIFSEKVMPAKMDLIGKFDRYAIVGGPHWIGNLAVAMRAIIGAEIRIFELGEQDQALKWLSEEKSSEG